MGALRQAVFLDPSDELSRFFYALALRESGDARQAGRQLRTVVERLEPRGPEERLRDGETTAAELLRSALSLEAQWR